MFCRAPSRGLKCIVGINPALWAGLWHLGPHPWAKNKPGLMADSYVLALTNILAHANICAVRVKFYRTSSGRSPVEDFLKKCSVNIRSDFLDALSLLEQGKTLSMPVSRNLASIRLGLNELRLKDRSGQYRYFYFVKKRDGIYFLSAFKKKSQELPQKEIDLALKRLKGI